jgi:hypothetical protein
MRLLVSAGDDGTIRFAIRRAPADEFAPLHVVPAAHDGMAVHCLHVAAASRHVITGTRALCVTARVVHRVRRRWC